MDLRSRIYPDTGYGILDEVPIHLVTMEEIMCHVTESIEHSSTLNIGYVNAHVLNLAQSNHELRAHYNP